MIFGGQQPDKSVGEAIAAEIEVGEFKLGKEEQWRYDQLLLAGFTESQSVFLAMSRGQVDLHEACALAERAGPELAYKILH